MTRAISWMAVWILGTVVCACSGGGGGSSSTTSSSSSSGGAESELDVAIAYRNIAFARCGYFDRCKEARGPLFTTEDLCRRFASADLLMNHGTYERLDLGYVVDNVAALACVSTLQQATCSEPVPDAAMACPGVLKPKTLLVLGASCWPSMTAGTGLCGPRFESHCVSTTGECGTCVAAQPAGGACQWAEDCQSGLCGSSGTCVSARISGVGAEASECTVESQCAPPLACAGLAPAHCQRRGLQGDGCDPATPCTNELRCVGGLCTPRLSEGESCQRQGGENACLDFCVFDTAAAASGHCAAMGRLPGNGEPCAVRDVGGARFTVCSSGLEANLYQEKVGITSCLCMQRGEGAAACSSDDECRSGICDGDTTTILGTCTALKPVGATCSANRYCESGYCSMASAIPSCAAIPMCQ